MTAGPGHNHPEESLNFLASWFMLHSNSFPQRLLCAKRYPIYFERLLSQFNIMPKILLVFLGSPRDYRPVVPAGDISAIVKFVSPFLNWLSCWHNRLFSGLRTYGPHTLRAILFAANSWFGMLHKFQSPKTVILASTIYPLCTH